MTLKIFLLLLPILVAAHGHKAVQKNGISITSPLHASMLASSNMTAGNNRSKRSMYVFHFYVKTCFNGDLKHLMSELFTCMKKCDPNGAKNLEEVRRYMSESTEMVEVALFNIVTRKSKSNFKDLCEDIKKGSFDSSFDDHYGCIRKCPDRYQNPHFRHMLSIADDFSKTARSLCSSHPECLNDSDRLFEKIQSLCQPAITKFNLYGKHFLKTDGKLFCEMLLCPSESVLKAKVMDDRCAKEVKKLVALNDEMAIRAFLLGIDETKAHLRERVYGVKTVIKESDKCTDFSATI